MILRITRDAILSVSASFPHLVPSIEFLCLVDEHDGDVVPDFIEKPATITDEPVARLVETKVSLALGAGQNLKQILAECHLLYPLKRIELTRRDR